MLMAVLFIKARSRKQTRCPCAVKWTCKGTFTQWNTTQDNNEQTVTKCNKWRTLTNKILSEGNQTQKGVCCRVPLTKVLKQVKLICGV